MKIPVGLIVALLLACAGCAGGGPATASTPPTVDVTGYWVGTWVGSIGSGAIYMTLKQTGPQYTGELRVTGSGTDPSGFTQGTVSGNELRIVQPSSLSGSLTVQGDRMSGDVQGMISAKVTLQRQR